MKLRRNTSWACILWLSLSLSSLFAQESMSNKKDGGYQFTVIKKLEALPVQNQDRTGTCWSFSALSFFESELIRMGKGKHKLSEMFIVRHAYLEKAINYVRMHGNFNFGAGGAFHDIPLVIRKYGIVPAETYTGRAYEGNQHNHAEMDNMLKAMVDVIVKNPQKKLTTSWTKAVEGVLDAYLGTAPKEFEYQKKKQTPHSFAKELNLNMDDYVILTSFTHHPFYQSFVLEIPDNWALASAYNLPLDELMEVMEEAVKDGYSIAWASDVSEKGFSFRDGLAIVPQDEDAITKSGQDNRHFSDAGAEKKGSPFEKPSPEKVITQQMRQEAFDNYQTTDDHGMHITGLVKDQQGTKYYLVKNSWGASNDCQGYLFASEAYVRYKTTNIMLHKDALPKKIAKKLNLR
jgi:bleomycin hydrolase